MQTYKGKLITLEGIEGVGKSTNVEFIKSIFVEHNIPLVVTREPGGTPFAEEIRRLLVSKCEEKMSHDAELLLVFAARAQHLQQVILPALMAGKWVLSDRFTDATYAYQGGGRGISLEKIAQLEQLIQDDLRPALTIILDMSIELGAQRAAQRGEALDRFELEKKLFFQNVRKVYLQRATSDSQRCRVIDASQNLIEVQNELRHVVELFLQQSEVI